MGRGSAGKESIEDPHDIALIHLEMRRPMLRLASPRSSAAFEGLLQSFPGQSRATASRTDLPKGAKSVEAWIDRCGLRRFQLFPKTVPELERDPVGLQLDQRAHQGGRCAGDRAASHLEPNEFDHRCLEKKLDTQSVAAQWVSRLAVVGGAVEVAGARAVGG